MKINSSYLVAGIALLLIIVWFVVNWFFGADAAITNAPPAAQNEALTQVSVQSVTATPHEIRYTLYGRTEASREVMVKAETPGLVVALGPQEGDRVGAGQLLCRQDVDARRAVLDQARANQKSVEADLNAARILSEKGYQSKTRVNAFEAQLDGAKAAVKQAEVELDNVNIRAPFSGIWERKSAEVGDYLAPGQPCGLLVDLSPLTVSAQLTEGQIGAIGRGDSTQIKLATGQTVTGTVKFIEAKADPATRTFRVEMNVPNDDLKLKAGVTATVTLSAGETLAQQIPGSILTLDEAGEIGVRFIDDANIVRFARVVTIDETPDGLWVTGLPEQTRIIVQGQDFVSVGKEIDPQIAATR
ncbi:efflux RND transporter periplasmic adaptor subunit [Robiginitomaculum antarcticum]|uniref:efflux RND transporter periplasmic adaptor subunit n=1 Tax=Robiginitomaculum antarcticum TaxID=437507 RepID=UPI0003715592|nr:efflux RND transporter periplasmic adaptor subunit [Robiginitomaculum antarcticum]